MANFLQRMFTLPGSGYQASAMQGQQALQDRQMALYDQVQPQLTNYAQGLIQGNSPAAQAQLNTTLGNAQRDYQFASGAMEGNLAQRGLANSSVNDAMSAALGRAFLQQTNAARMQAMQDEENRRQYGYNLLAGMINPQALMAGYQQIGNNAAQLSNQYGQMVGQAVGLATAQPWRQQAIPRYPAVGAG
jgi:hypothetical protein